MAENVSNIKLGAEYAYVSHPPNFQLLYKMSSFYLEGIEENTDIR